MAQQLALGFKQETVPLVGALTVLLKARKLSVAPGDLSTANISPRVGIIQQVRLLKEHLIELLSPILQLIKLRCALVGLGSESKVVLFLFLQGRSNLVDPFMLLVSNLMRLPQAPLGGFDSLVKVRALVF